MRTRTRQLANAQVPDTLKKSGNIGDHRSGGSMRGTLIAAVAASAAAFVVATGAPAAFAQSLTTMPDVFERYEDAFNRHDADAVARFWALDPATEDATLARWKGERDFEAATHAVFRISAKSLGGDAFEVTQHEDCDYYREIGSGIRTSTFVVHLRDGKFHDVQRGTTTDSGNSYDEAKARFEVWIAKNRPDQARVVMNEGELVFNGVTAGVIMKLLGEWNSSRS